MTKDVSEQPPPTEDAHAALPAALYVVATPIGNLGDLSPRARETLAQVALIAAEDTRHTRSLLQAFGIATPLVSLHEHNEAARLGPLVERLRRGEAVALVSDAGTPLVSDPGFALVRAALDAGIRVTPIPGPTAAITALSASGLPTDRFAFEGFLPSKPGARKNALLELSREARTLIFYEAPHRLNEVLLAMVEVLGAERRASIGRELTKRFESMYYGTLAELAERSTQDADMSRGELVIVVAGLTAAEAPALAIDADKVLKTLLEELPAAQAAKLAARITGEKRAVLYERAVQLQK
ncbi:MAG: 16S rRNA (cytidine(1402)-2'-O)-methyltransferase [Steroidobacteraceae bacterium]